MNSVLLKGRLDKWKTKRNIKIMFSATEKGLCFDECGSSKSKREVWTSEDIIITEDKDEGIIWIANKETKYLIKEKYITTKGKAWLSILRSKGSSLKQNKNPMVDNIIQGSGELVPYLEGYLQKWAAVMYNKRWFVISDDTLLYYADNDEKKIKGSMLIRQTNILATIENDSKSTFILHDGVSKYYLMANKDSEKKEWIENLTKRGSKLINEDKLHSLECCSELIPSLTFPTLTNKDEDFCDGEDNDMKFLKHTKNVVKTIVENGADVAIKILLPAGGLISMALKGTVSGAVKIVDFFTQPDLADLEQKMDDKINAKLFHSKLCSLEAEMFATHKRYCNILNKDFTLDQRVNEIPTTMQSFEKAIHLFDNDPLFMNNSYQMAPYLVKFSYFYLAFAEVAVVIHPYYKNELKGEMQKLTECLETYKEKAMAFRLMSIKRHDTVGNGILTLLHIGPLIAGPIIQESIKGHSSTYNALPDAKLTDHLYFSNPKQNTKVAYCDVDDEYDEFLDNYRDKIEAMYSSFLDKIILELKSSVVMS